jgi:hypothetical protein
VRSEGRFNAKTQRSRYARNPQTRLDGVWAALQCYISICSQAVKTLLGKQPMRAVFAVRPARWRCRKMWGGPKAGASSTHSQRFAWQFIHMNIRSLSTMGTLAVQNADLGLVSGLHLLHSSHDSCRNQLKARLSDSCKRFPSPGICKLRLPQDLPRTMTLGGSTDNPFLRHRPDSIWGEHPISKSRRGCIN